MDYDKFHFTLNKYFSKEVSVTFTHSLTNTLIFLDSPIPFNYCLFVSHATNV